MLPPRRWALTAFIAVAGCAALLVHASPERDRVDAAHGAPGGLTLSSVGDPAMAALMDAWLAALQKAHPVRKGARWEHVSDARAIGALMFELADVAPIAREFQAAEIAPYAHQFAGDMMKSPLLIRVAGTAERPAYIAVNKRPDSPLPPAAHAFIAYALSAEGQAIVARLPGFPALAPEEAARQRAKLEGFVAPLDPALSLYRPVPDLRGAIRSVGSDGMKSLMERWMHDFERLQPGIRKGDRWEHLGTLNGFHAMLADETDLAPMGRELWPGELAEYKATHGGNPPLEIRVARGGFNTPQRTTAQAIFVNAQNPIAGITLRQLAAVFADPPRITRWGQLGLGGEWAERPVAFYLPPQAAPNAMSMQITLLGAAPWNAVARQGSVAATAAAIAHDAGAIGFGGFEDGGAGLRAVPVSAGEGEPFVAGSPQTASSGRYPLTRYMYIRLDPSALSAPTRAFLRFVLSREGQDPIRYSGYFPLDAAEARKELAKLDASLHE